MELSMPSGPDCRPLTFRPVTGDDRLVAWLWAVSAAATAIAGGFIPRIAAGLPSCAFKSLTGLPCPTCGTSRAIEALYHGDVPSALLLNPLSTLALAVFVLAGAAALLWILGVIRVAPVLPHPLPGGWRWAMATALLVNWALVIGLSR